MMSEFNQLKQYLGQRAPQGIALAFSGSAAGMLLLAVMESLLSEMCFPVIALTIHSIFSGADELERLKFAVIGAGVRLKFLACDPMVLQEFRQRFRNRFHWRREYVFSELSAYLAGGNFEFLVDGMTADDEKRVGATALRGGHLRMCSPLKELGFDQTDVEKLVRQLELKCPGRVELSCIRAVF